MVESTLNYMASMGERPRYYTYPPPPGERARNTRGDRQIVPIRDARELSPAPSLDREGFALVPLATTADLWDPDAVRASYFPAVEASVARDTGASRVVAFDHNVRSGRPEERRDEGATGPVRYAHNDYTLASGPQRVRDLLPEEADALLARRFAVVNVWKPITGPVLQAPLAFCDARSIGEGDLVATDLVYQDRSGEVYSMAFRPEHRWYYYPAMRADEALLLKCYDSDPDVARFTAHTAFDDPSTPEDAPPRESIEVRTLAFF